MPFLKKVAVRRYCNDVLDVRMSEEIVRNFDNAICLILGSAAKLSKKRNHRIMSKEDLLSVINNGLLSKDAAGITLGERETK